MICSGRTSFSQKCCRSVEACYINESISGLTINKHASLGLSVLFSVILLEGYVSLNLDGRCLDGHPRHTVSCLP